MNTNLKEYLGAPTDRRRELMKDDYLARAPKDSSARDQAIFHLAALVECTRRLNLVECKGGSQPTPNPSVLRKTDLFVCVEICAESIHENTFLKNDDQFWRCWTAFENLLRRVKSKAGTEAFFEAAYLLLHLAALILTRQIADGTIEKGPEMFSIGEYAALATGFPRPLFESLKSAGEQLQNLTENLTNLARV